MKTDTIIHQLRINSLLDTSALCTCGEWSFVRTGAATRKHVEEEFNRHIAAVFPSARAKHTEGPWKVFSVNATIGTGAAPEMLEALQALCGRAKGLLDVDKETEWLWNKLGPEYRQALAAIAKAVGE